MLSSGFFSHWDAGMPILLLLGVSVAAICFVAWSAIWKGWALWIAARSGSKVWFILFLFVNTLGILEIIYIFVVSKQKPTIVSAAPEIPSDPDQSK